MPLNSLEKMISADHPFFLAHEQAHIMLKHELKRKMLFTVIISASLAFAKILNFSVFFILLSPILSLWLSSPLWLWWMRKQELSADRLATQLTSKTSAKHSLNMLKNRNFSLFSTHPTKNQRLFAIFYKF